MAKKKADTEKVVIAELSVTSSEGMEVVRGFDVAWHRAREIARRTTPVLTSFNGFVRKD